MDRRENPKDEAAVHPAPYTVVLLAGIWDRAEIADGTIESYALTTLPPDPAVEKYHDRAPLVLGPGDYAAWLDSPTGATSLFDAPRKLPLHVELATV